MSSIFQKINTDLVAIIVLIFTIYLVNKNTIMTKSKTRKYMFASLMTLAVTLLEIVTILLAAKTGSAWQVPHLAANVLGFSLAPAIPLSLSLLYNERIYKHIRYLSIPLLLHASLCVLSAWTGWLFTVSSNNEYSRGPLFCINAIISLYSFIILIYANQTGSKEMDRSQRVYLAMLYILVISANIVQIAFSGMLLIWVSVAISMLLYYNFLNEMSFRFDPTTGIQNRYSFERRLIEMQKLDRATIVVFDLNNLKEINDSQGHFVGDNCLSTAADSIKKGFEGLGTAFRIGGDEFCVLCNGRVEAERLEEAFTGVEALSRRYDAAAQALLSVAYGYSYFDRTVDGDIFRSFAKADSAMYEHKLILKSRSDA
ncbi:MAG: GGDEF domain-containing protein [Saccharofermentanales bacterium]